MTSPSVPARSGVARALPPVNALLFDQISQLDLTGPAEVFADAGMTVDLVGRTFSPVVTDGGWSINPTHALE